MQHKSSRRHFLQAAGVSAVAGAVGSTIARPTASANQQPSSGAGARQKFRLGLASYTLRKFSLEETLDMTQQLALEWICLKSMHLPLEASNQELAAAASKIKQAGITLYGGGVIKMSTQEDTNRAFEYAKAAGMTTIVGVPAPEMLPLVDKKVKEYDIKVAIHNHGPGDDIYPTPESAYVKVKDLDPRIGLCIDIGHTVRIGADPYESAKRFADRLHDVHIKDVTAATAEGKTLQIGRGVINIPWFLHTLIETGYSGVVAFEYEKDPDDPFAGLAESVGYVRGVLASI